MKITMKRIAKKANYTISHIYIDDKYFCDAIEDKDRGLTQTMKLADIKKIKVKSQTAIPTGTYNVTVNVVSPKFSQKDFYKKNANGGKVPRLLSVPGFDGILMHCGTDLNSSAGCIIIGENKVVGKVINSQLTFLKFYPKLVEANEKGEKITITIS